VKALALGAKAVLVGRAPLYGTAVAGEAGAARALEIYRDEIDRLLALIGCPGVAALSRDYLAPPFDEPAGHGAASRTADGIKAVRGI
jgi:(S)-mandelate dehydrogenase